MACPLIAAITGLSICQGYTWGGGSPRRSLRPSTKPPKVAPPPPRSAPAQNARPAPVSTTARTSSSSWQERRASEISKAMRGVQAFIRSGRLSVIVATRSFRSRRIAS
jgi:hypothetical protein